MKIARIFLAVCGVVLIKNTKGHGMMLEPPNRSSLWRFDDSAPANYDDNQNYCGGATVQWSTFKGKCGVCGDRFDASHPQANENTGKYGQGKVVRTYKSGSVIDVTILLTTNHMGSFHYSVCKLDNPNAPEAGEDCFMPITMENGSDKYDVSYEEKSIANRVKLPDGLVCPRCVLRWHYSAGNNWGDCGDGTYAQGCGPQETFRSCADITITN